MPDRACRDCKHYKVQPFHKNWNERHPTNQHGECVIQMGDGVEEFHIDNVEGGSGLLESIDVRADFGCRTFEATP